MTPKPLSRKKLRWPDGTPTCSAATDRRESGDRVRRAILRHNRGEN